MTWKPRYSLDSEEIGWISLVDLMVVLCCVGLLTLVSAFADMEVSRGGAHEPEDQIQAQRERIERLESERSEWHRKFEVTRDLLAALKASSGSGGATSPETLLAVALQEKAAIAESEARLERELQSSRVKIDAVARESSAAQAKIRALIEEISVAAVQTAAMEADLLKARAVNLYLTSSLAQWQERDKDLGRIRQELLGLTGEISNVVFVIDRSDSMKLRGRWPDAKRTIASWISFLPVKRAALILFGSDIKVIPSSITLSDALAPESREIPVMDDMQRQQMMRELDEIEPSGGTHTYAALLRAMEFRDVDAIILFTDGNPDSNGGAGTAEDVHRLISDWRVAHRSAKVHAVGIGEYFNVGMRDFLLGVAKHGDGSFIGR